MTLADLITRVESGSGSDRQLDREIIQALHPDIGECTPHCMGDEPIFWHNPFHKMPAPHLTSSLDAIRALFKARLEGYCVHIYDDGFPHAGVFARGYQLTTVGTDIHRAFLSATLKAIAAKEG